MKVPLVYKHKGRKEKKEDKDKKRILSKARGVNLTIEYERQYGRLTGDEQEIHENKRAAQDAGLRLTHCPVRGARLADIAYNAARALYHLTTPGRDDLSFRQTTKFLLPVYQPRRVARRTLRWLIGEVRKDEKEATLELIAHYKGAAVVKSVLQAEEWCEYRPPKEETILAGPISAPIDPTDESMRVHERLMRPQQVRSRGFPPALVQSYVPGILVRILKKAYEDTPSHDRPLPVNCTMETKWYNEIKEGRIETQTFMTFQKRKANIWRDEFHTVLVQGGSICAATDVVSYSAKQIDPEKLKTLNEIDSFAYRPQTRMSTLYR